MVGVQKVAMVFAFVSVSLCVGCDTQELSSGDAGSSAQEDTGWDEDWDSGEDWDTGDDWDGWDTSDADAHVAVDVYDGQSAVDDSGTSDSGTDDSGTMGEQDTSGTVDPGADSGSGTGNVQLDPTYNPNPDECYPLRNRYNCKPPIDGTHRPRMTNPSTGDMYWPLAATTELMDGYGNVRGTVESTRVKINGGMRKVLHGQSVVYVWAAKLTSGIYASGWIFENNLQDAAYLRQNMETIWLPNPHRGHYVTEWEITGGNNAEFQDLTVTKGHSGGGRRATDYLLRPGNVVNLIFNVPGREMGGFSVDTIPPGGSFWRARGVLEDQIPLYNLGGTTPVKQMKFVYGYFHDGSQRRYGWIAKAALAPKTQHAYGTCEVTCCDGESQSFPAVTQQDCRDGYGWCSGHGAARDITYDGANIYHRTESCTTATYCCALCNNRSAYHRVEGVEWDCTAQAREYCGQNSRGGLDDADWRYCTP